MWISITPIPYSFGIKLIRFYSLKEKCLSAPHSSNALIGDSFFSRFEWKHNDLFKIYFTEWINLGIGDDRVEHLLWRILKGGIPQHLDKLIISIGSNNINHVTPTVITSFIMKAAALLHGKVDHIYICEQFPRENMDTSSEIKQLNKLLEELCEKEGYFYIKQDEIFWRGSISIRITLYRIKCI